MLILRFAILFSLTLRNSDYRPAPEPGFFSHSHFSPPSHSRLSNFLLSHTSDREQPQQLLIRLRRFLLNRFTSIHTTMPANIRSTTIYCHKLLCMFYFFFALFFCLVSFLPSVGCSATIRRLELSLITLRVIS